MALHEVPAHARRRPHRPLQVDARPGRQPAEVRQSQRLGRDAHRERRERRPGPGPAPPSAVTVRHTPLTAMLSPSPASDSSSDRDGSVTVSDVPPVASWLSSSDTTSTAPAPAGQSAVLMAVGGGAREGGEQPPISSTIPVNIFGLGDLDTLRCAVLCCCYRMLQQLLYECLSEAACRNTHVHVPTFGVGTEYGVGRQAHIIMRTQVKSTYL